MSDEQKETTEIEPFELLFKINGEKTKFRSRGSLQKFIDDNLEAFRFLTHSRDNYSLSRNIYISFYKPFFDTLNSIANSMQLIVPHSEYQHKINEFNHMFSTFPIPLVGSGYEKLIIEEAKNDSELAACIIFLLFAPNEGAISETGVISQTGKNLIKIYNYANSPNHQLCKALESNKLKLLKSNRLLAKWEIFSKDPSTQNIINDLESVVRKIADTLKESQKVVDEYHEVFNQEKHQLTQDRKTFQALLETSKSDYNKLTTEAGELASATFNKLLRKTIQHKRSVTKKVNQDIQESKARLALSEKTYNEKIALNESVGYWGAKETLHSDEMRNWGISLIASMILTLILPLFVSVTIHDYTKADVADKLFFGVVNPLSATGLLITLSLCTYAIRFCSRQFSSAKHLKLEATERKTMIRTYLALMNEDKLKEAEDRKVALDTMFRPSQTGIVADNQSVMPTDSVIKVLTRQQKA